MKNLSENWFTEGWIDFEYKQYILLAYLEEVKKLFSLQMLYPALADLLRHYQNLVQYRETKRMLMGKFPQALTNVDFSQMKLVFKPTVEDDEMMSELDSIVDFAIPKMKMHLQSGKELYDAIDHRLDVKPVGVLPMYKYEGYLLIRNGAAASIEVYQFHINVFSYREERVHGIHLNHVATLEGSLLTNYTSLKLDLIRERSELPNPATYLVEIDQAFPIDETILPILKRKLLSLARDKA